MSIGLTVIADVFVVNLRCDSADHATVPVRQEELDVGMSVEGIVFGRERLALNTPKRRNPILVGSVAAVGQFEEIVEVLL
jgi:hypothetical protein